MPDRVDRTVTARSDTGGGLDAQVQLLSGGPSAAGTGAHRTGYARHAAVARVTAEISFYRHHRLTPREKPLKVMSLLGSAARAVTARIGYLRAVPPITLGGAVVVISGGGRGIGAATAAAFAARGAAVWIGDLDAEVAGATAARIPGATARLLDVRSPSSWRALIDEVLGVHGRIDVLVNNAGVMPVGPFLNQDQAVTDLMVDVNLRGVLSGMAAVLPAMTAAGRGHIVNVSSMAGAIPLPGMVTYNATKYGVVGASLAARREFDGTGVTVSAVLPAAVRTELSSGADLSALPTVDPDQVATQIVDTVTTRAPRVSAPTWVRRGWQLAETFVPETVERAARRLIGHDQALALDPVGRRDYLGRIDRHARSAAHRGSGDAGSPAADTGGAAR